MAVLQLIRCMSLHAMALSALSSFPVHSREKKPSPFILTVQVTGNPLRGHKAAAAAGGLHSPAPHSAQPCPQPNSPQRFGKTEVAPNHAWQSWGDLSSAPNGTVHPGRDEPAPFPTRAGCDLPVHHCNEAAVRTGGFRETKIFLHLSFPV